MSNNNLEITEATLLRGRVKLLQPKTGFHASIDTVFLAAAARVKERCKLLDIGCGVGSAGLCVTSRKDNISLVGIDIQEELVDLAHQNAALNKVDDRTKFFQGDLQKEKVIADNYFDTVIMNPPYFEDGKHLQSPEKIKATSHAEGVSGASLKDWVKYAHRKLKQGGYLTMIHRADRLDDIILTLTERRWFGSLVIYPLYPRKGENAKRVIIRARKERYATLILKSGMVIHTESGTYTKPAQEILSEAKVINLD